MSYAAHDEFNSRTKVDFSHTLAKLSGNVEKRPVQLLRRLPNAVDLVCRLHSAGLAQNE